MELKVLSHIGFVLLLAVACQCCSTSPSEEAPGKSHRIFAGYLEEQFSLSIPDRKHYYILIPRLICRGCVEQKFDELDAMVDDDNRASFTVITTNLPAIPAGISNKLTVLYDSAGMLDRLNLRIANMTVARTDKGRLLEIVSISTIDPPELKEVVIF